MVREKVDVVFGIPGGYLTGLMDAWARAGIKSIEGRHEGAVACMAAGYTQASGKIGVIYGQSGPGPTNALTGVAAAYMDSVPMIVICGQTFSMDYARDGHQEASGVTRGVDQVRIFDSVALFQGRPPNAESAIRCLRLAFSSALGGRGPAILEVAADLFSKSVEFFDLAPSSYRASVNLVDREGVQEIATRLQKAQRPIVIIGNRASHIGAAQDLAAICEKQEIPFAAVDYAKGVLPEDHPLCLGILGQGGHPSVVEYMRQSDLVLLLGVRMNHATTIRYDETLFKNLIQIDDDYREIGRSLPVELGVVGHIGPTIKALREAVDGLKTQRSSRSLVKELRQKHQVYERLNLVGEPGPIRMPGLFRAMREVLPRETLMVSDTGLTALQLKAHFPVYAEDGFFGLYALAAMGSGLPMALGVQLARPEATVVSVIGDGGFLVHTGELNVAVQHQLPVIHVVVKNGFYKSVSSRQEAWFGKSYATEIKNGDYAAVARGFGCDGYSCKTLTEFQTALRSALTNRRPTVIEVDVDPNESLVETMSPKMKKLMDTVWKSRPKGWPFPK